MQTSDRPSWPSLYNPAIELLHIAGREPLAPGGTYLSYSTDIFKFTLFWTLCFHTPIFVVCGIYAFLNLTFPPSTTTTAVSEEDATLPALSIPSVHARELSNESSAYPMSPLFSLAHSMSTTPLIPSNKPKKKSNAGRSRVTFALLVFLTFLTLSLIGSVASAALVGFVLTGLFRAGKFHMSTWIPFLWALIHTVIGLLAIWPSVIDIV
ncbi:hypothetical protein C8J56DRAFT_535958 [Mycena floridula]|nr:hypothetical protein C8J56DRAFT_535958 [Mycena floridula]